jgi:hypothetical protein
LLDPDVQVCNREEESTGADDPVQDAGDECDDCG